MLYNAPNASPSSIGTQFRTDYYEKKALIEIAKETYFGQLADVTNMPKNMGKTIKKYHYMPLLDDSNINDQGIDAAGVTLTTTMYEVTFPVLEGNPVVTETEASATAIAAINDNIHNSGAALVIAEDGAAETVDIDLLSNTDLVIRYATEAKAQAVVDEVKGTFLAQVSGNLYGSSKDIGYISGKLPALSETGGRVNRVGFKRIDLEGTIEKFGFFDEYSQETMDFDTDADLEMHVHREMLAGANEMTEDALQIDLLNAAGVIRYGGAATSNATISGEAGSVCEVDYDDFMNLAIDLDNNRCPKHTKVITGSRMVDTKVVNACRVMYMGTEMQPTIEKMVNHFSAQAFIPVAQYADAGTILNGEIGSVGQFRVVIHPEMMHWSGAGATVVADTTYRQTNGRFDVFPMLVVGNESFTTIGFQTDGKTVKFKITHKKPGDAVADRTDPYGETGFMSIKWYYGMLIQRSERLALMKSVGRL